MVPMTITENVVDIQLLLVEYMRVLDNSDVESRS